MIWKLMHGWGFESSVWDVWSESLPESSEVHLHDRGYFGTSGEPRFFLDDTAHTIVVTHSLGLHFIPKEMFAQITNLVVIGGFLSFHPDEEPAKSHSSKIIHSMIERIGQEPDALLDDFYRNCFSPSPVSYKNPGRPNGKRLRDDLELLDVHRISVSDLMLVEKLLILYGRNDRILDYRKGEEIHARLPKSTLYLHESEGHALPFLDPEWCLGRISNWLSEDDE